MINNFFYERLLHHNSHNVSKELIIVTKRSLIKGEGIITVYTNHNGSASRHYAVSESLSTNHQPSVLLVV